MTRPAALRSLLGRSTRRREAERFHAETRARLLALVCEDEEALRRLAERTLVENGYTVLAAARPSEALALAAAHPGEIDALVTDVVMPEMSGSQLAERLRAIRPGVRVLFMSGYTAETIGTRGNLPEGSTLIEKPFELDDLPRAVRELLDDNARTHPVERSREP